MEYQKNKTRPKFKKTERPLGFQGYYVEVREGEDAIRAYRKIKRWIKEDKFIDQSEQTTPTKNHQRSKSRRTRNVGRYYVNYVENVTVSFQCVHKEADNFTTQ